MATGDQGRSRTYRSDRRTEQARTTRRRIVQSASAQFLERGYHAATFRQIAAAAAVSVPAVELLFGTKARLLRAAIDMAIAGDDEAVPVLERDWTAAVQKTASIDEFFAIAAGVITAAQARSAGLVLAVFEASTGDPELAELSKQMIDQRSVTATWLVNALSTKTSIRGGSDREEAIDTLWVLMDPAIFDRLIRQRRWSTQQYQQWFARSARRLLVADQPSPNPSLEATT